jgi:hypothetical protein
LHDPLLYAVQEICYNEDTKSYGIFIEPEMERVEKLETTDFFEDEKSGVGKIEFFHKIQHSADLSVGDVVSFYWVPPYSLLWIGDFPIKTFKLFIFIDCFLEIFSALMSLLVIIFLVFILYIICNISKDWSQIC